jgi:hypothetical protein
MQTSIHVTKKWKILGTLAVSLLFASVLAIIVLAAPNAADIDWWIIGGGGGSDTGGAYALDVAIGQPVAGADSAGSYDLCAGFWCGATASTCYTLTTTADPVAGGSINADPAPNCNVTQYTEGSTVTLTAVSNSGYTFDQWSGDASGSDNPIEVLMDADRDITAYFTVTTGACYTLSTSANPATGGDVNANPAPNCNVTQYTEGSTVTLTAVPNAGYTFDRWSGDASGSSNPIDVVMDADRAVIAHLSQSFVIYLPIVVNNLGAP